LGLPELGVGGAHSSKEGLETIPSQGALACSKLTQKETALMDEQSKTEQPARELRLREAMLPEKVRLWRAKLSTKAKQQKRWRFYSLYDLIRHPETLRGAWQQVRVNAGAPGVDGISFAQIEAKGVEQWLEDASCKTLTREPLDLLRILLLLGQQSSSGARCVRAANCF
jgi:hypothetical protein